MITAGQQVRAQITIEANLTNRDATIAPQPYVKYSHEPPRAADVPGALGRAIHHAMLPPRGPAFVSIPMDDWSQEADEDRSRNAGRADASAGASRLTRRRCPRSRTGSRTRAGPVLVAGPDIDASGGWDARGRAGRETAPAGLGDRRRRAARGSASPSATRTSSASCRRRSAAISETLKEHDLVLVVGSSVFPYYPYIPGPLLGPETSLVAITSDPVEAARAPMGDAIVGDVALALQTLVDLVARSRTPGAPSARRARRAAIR